MFVGTPLGRNSSSPVPAHSPSPDGQSGGPAQPPLPESPPCWATRARWDLAQAEAELRRLRERHATETDTVKRGVERAVSGARREERRLLERVEQDHRDTQQHLEQVQRENMAAARVSQSLLDQRLRSLARLQQRIQEVGQQSCPEDGGPNQLLKDVAEFLQPWEVSVSLKKVNFKPSSQPHAKGESALVELDEEGDSSLTVFNPRGVHLIRQFGKQGSGRADLTLPSGIHATPQGLLYIVDCGNARVQVCVVSNVFLTRTKYLTSPTSDGSARRYELEAPRGVTTTRLDEFLVADIRKGSLIALKLDPKTGSRLERTVVTGFHRPYLVAACSSSGMVAVSERGNETGRVPCIKVLEPGWNTVRVLGICAGMGPVLACPWGICIDTDGNVLVADWGEQHRVLLYPAQGVGWPIVTQGLSSPRGLALLPEGQLAVSDSMHHCIKIYPYKVTHG
uniref:E3 ubiquitin-protein ligase TRIM32 n=1 Tax=Cyclopterus lumpus TaxID=8103 RepID=A0A8C2XLI1_CYCLU